MTEDPEGGPRRAHPVLLYDGVCGLCNRLVQFILRRDSGDTFRFASLQGALAASILTRHRLNVTSLDTVYLVIDYNLPGESILSRSDAVVFVLVQLGGVWGLIARIVDLIPHRGRDWTYRVVARSRYRIFGRYDTCPLPSESTRAKFLDQ